MENFSGQYKPATSIADYLVIGSKSDGEQTLGFELEHFVVEKGSHAAVPFCVASDSPAPSVEKVLEGIKTYYDETVYESDQGSQPHLFGLGRDRAAVTLEPGAQLEISIGPAHSIGEIEQLYQEFRREIDPVLDKMGLELLERGYHPTQLARNMQLLPKHRYRFMDQYFSETGKHGICMMRGTASTQVSIDFKSEKDALAKFRIANALGPLFAFITDNAPVFESETVSACGGIADVAQSGLAVPRRMARMACWDDTDPARSLIVKGGFDSDFSFRQYAETLVDSPGIFLPDDSGESDAEYIGFTTFKQALANEFIDEDMVLHILSLFFFDTRFKSYVELRQADSLPLEYALAFTALVSGIFYNAKAIQYYSENLRSVDSASVAAAKSSLRAQGYDAEVYGRLAVEWLDEMLMFAQEGLSEADYPYLAPLAQLIEQRSTLLDSLS